MPTKPEIRKTYLEKRMKLSFEMSVQLSRQILAQFKHLDLSNIHCIHIYLPLVIKKEPDTTVFTDWLKHEHPGIKIAYPKTNFSDTSIRSFTDDSELKLRTTVFGITEPLSGNEISTDKIDMVIVPLLAFDKKGYRVGYGKGFYDRFLPKCKPGTQFVGLSFFEAVDAIEDVDQYDIKLHKCITPQKVWNF